jgi:predicted phage tail protein
MLRKIKLYGKLAKFIGHRVLEADVATAAEAVRFLLANWPEAEAHMERPALPRQHRHLRHRPRRAASPSRRRTHQLRAGSSRCWRSGADY